ncbi:MAG: transaldolase [Pseudomonadales bacterium]|nr:transaldolase [Pseudomonadales bacterium]
MTSKLEQLRKMTTVVADTGDIDAIRDHQPVDATTNPTLLLKASVQKQYQGLVKDAVTWAQQQGGTQQQVLANSCDRFAVVIGKEILQLIPGRVSTEVDARLSFDTRKTIEKARYLVHLYNEMGIGNDRLLIKIAASWEGIQAASVLEQEGINCNLTLLFGFSQALACADAKAFLISPFVGRILDWYKKDTGNESYTASEDPGVLSVSRIYNYYKSYDIGTIVMGASFRNQQQIEQLAGCDRLTISPQFLEQLSADETELPRVLSPEGKPPSVDPKTTLSEKEFRWLLNQDTMATEKLAEGIRNFAADQIKLEQSLNPSAG